MAVGHYQFPDMLPVAGVSLGTSCAGIKQTERDDLLVIKIAEGSECAGVFTTNAFCAAPIIIAKQHLNCAPRWLMINSGNANAGTGALGIEDTLATCRSLGSLSNHNETQVLPFSTGVIGERLPVDKITPALPTALNNLSPKHWPQAAEAIMTTDTFPKGASTTIEIDGQPITITGISKGAGMIQPNMATMLAFITTDAKIAQPVLQNCLETVVNRSFNRITVDGDTSTNDACILVSTGQSDTSEIKPDSKQFQLFLDALTNVSKQLAEAIVRDGEGATKLIHIIVKEALNSDEAIQVAKTIAHSPLVKTAFFASDPNWGRILAAVGRAEIDNLQIEPIRIHLDDVCIVSNGSRDKHYTEQAGQQVMARDEIYITVALGRGTAEEQVLSCDLSYDYVKINAEYRT